jgi:hypothetical protein
MNLAGGAKPKSRSEQEVASTVAVSFNVCQMPWKIVVEEEAAVCRQRFSSLSEDACARNVLVLQRPGSLVSSCAATAGNTDVAFPAVPDGKSAEAQRRQDFVAAVRCGESESGIRSGCSRNVATPTREGLVPPRQRP